MCLKKQTLYFLKRELPCRRGRSERYLFWLSLDSAVLSSTVSVQKYCLSGAQNGILET